MQLKGLVRFFTVALVLICIYQLSFTWMVHSHENKMEKKASAWVKANYATPEQKYAGNLEQQKLYADSLEVIQKAQTRHLLDSTRNAKIGPFGMTTYQKAKNSELMLGLDLQGGMSVTMEVGLDGLVHALSNYSKDPSINKAIDQAKAIKANDNTDYISLFAEQWKKVSNGKKLAPFFAQKSNKELTYESTDDQVILYLRKQAKAAFTNTYKILRTRIDRFGLSSPTINPDEAKGIITIELAGVNDAERVRHYLQSTANLQFFEVYNIQDIGADFQKVDGLLAKAGAGEKTESGDTASAAPAASATTAPAAAKADTAKGGNTSLSALEKTNTDTNATFADSDKTASGAVDSAKLIRQKYPFSSLFLDIARPYQDEQGHVGYPSYIGMVSKSDTAKLNKLLNSEIVKSAFPSNLVFMYGKPDEKNEQMRGVLQLYAIKTLDNGQARLEGDHITDASQGNNQMGQVTVNMKMDESGSRIWADMTKKNVGKPIAIVLDNIVYSAPNVSNEITGGNSEITGSYTVAEAQDMANILESGKLPAPAKIVQEQIVGPTLGQAAVTGGMISFGLSFVVIFALMLLYFNTAGWIANIALTLNLLFTIGVLCSLGFTLTAPGIAALVLTVGMAVDTNVIIFERIKEELVRGKGYLHAVEDGYKRSYAPVLDAHVTTLLTAIILFYFGLGPVLGFATTQIIGILLSLFCGILVSRLVSDIYTNKQRHFEYFTKISKKVFAHRAIPFVKYRKVAYVISVFVVVLGAASFYNGFNEGVEFSGGRSYTVKFEKAPDQDKVRDDLKAIFKDAPIIKTVNVPEQLNITTSYLIHETGKDVDAKVEQELYKGLQPYLPQATTFNSFKNNYIQSSQTVLPTISKDLKAGATKATIFAIIAICAYIFIRFRDWRFSLGTIVSLLHDVLVTLIVFSFFRNIVPFPLEIDQHFIAAVLTVIGFSMNDTVIVYDRIREDAGILHTLDKETIINKAINETLSRTIMTSLTVFLTILILFIFGGEVVRGFSFAMLIGVITGTYSSIFVAAPILIDFAKGKPLGKVKDHSVMERKHHEKLHPSK
ncbi:protein translocase subunit SecDF [Arachidicoccus terrestris]|uniref:protein translocase subunit SecDF n=1 Tax=Arachidicoccus terrestris TaxID=2875539 RepID=UPI001CC58AF4|nr:protein translocase subunit SecDF [Arachidicoccus terrestris]UAY54327.1 protein translocase subunit SecDF [Arachidicoccus terrestris]